MKDVYTLIGYRENYSTSCRGCVMNRYDSLFEVKQFITLDEVIEAYTNGKVIEGFYDYEYPNPMDYCLMLNGVVVFDELYVDKLILDDEDEWELVDNMRVDLSGLAEASIKQREDAISDLKLAKENQKIE